MSDKYRLMYKGYDLRGDPIRTASGRFESQLVIGYEVAGTTQEMLIPPLGEFQNEEEAGLNALAVGKRWVDEIG